VAAPFSGCMWRTPSGHHAAVRAIAGAARATVGGVTSRPVGVTSRSVGRSVRRGRCVARVGVRVGELPSLVDAPCDPREVVRSRQRAAPCRHVAPCCASSSVCNARGDTVRLSSFSPSTSVRIVSAHVHRWSPLMARSRVCERDLWRLTAQTLRRRWRRSPDW